MNGTAGTVEGATPTRSPKRAGNYEAKSKIERFLPKNRQSKLKLTHQREKCSTNEQSMKSDRSFMLKSVFFAGTVSHPYPGRCPDTENGSPTRFAARQRL
ncbi:hypothetical protein [Burkholderia pseudomallei]|uniref:hypothetical protein n=1 Tax=Burkholderia pseudomallei TaxID=28450 RepID=UPI001269CC8A|nr:hypothetical protein [Burkholderia pseudomallei]